MFQGCPIYTESLYNANHENSNDLIRLVRPLDSVKGVQQYAIRTFSREHAPPYAALSYSWGTRGQTASMILVSDVTQATLEITGDLEDALGSIKVSNVSDKPKCADWDGWLWVDQICINQADDLEKGDQVSRMREIYQGATCVFIWLGKEMHEKHDFESDPASDFGLTHCKVVDLLHQGLDCWWNRLWVVQEISLCDHLLVWIGEQCVYWADFVILFFYGLKGSRFQSVEDHIPTNSLDLTLEHSKPDYSAVLTSAQVQILALDQVRAQQRGAEEGEDLIKLLTSTLPSGVSNELDRVYSLLGLATADYRERVPVKYGISRAQLFSQVIIHAIERSGNLDVLFDGWPRGPGNSGGVNTAIPSTSPRYAMLYLPTAHRMDLVAPLPTWMPDFSKMKEGRYVKLNDLGFHAGSFAKSKITVADMELTLAAIELDIIEDVLDSLVEWCKTPDYKRCSTSMKRDLRRYEDYYLETKYCFRTKQGYQGFSSKVQAGDEVIVPFGARAPLVIRLHQVLDDGGDTKPRTPRYYGLVDECYVDGFMLGEIEEMKEAGRTKVKEYRIR